MTKRILVVTGSPRKHGNSDMLADAFIKGAREAKHTVDKFEAAFHKIDGCKACDTCWSKGVPCSFDDDFNTKFAPLLEQANMIVFCMPLYFYAFPTQIKAPMDKMYAYAGSRGPREPHITESAFMICGEEDTEPPYAGAVESYRQVANYLNWENRGIIIATALGTKGQIAGTHWLEKAEKLGLSI